MKPLSRTQLRTLEALGDTLLPSGLGRVPGAADVDLTAVVAGRIESYPPPVQRLLRAMITGFDVSGLASRQMRPFHRMSPSSAPISWSTWSG